VSTSFDLLETERITVGTVGVPGQRLFFLQARQDDQLVTLKMEKVQVAALAAWIAKTLEDLPAIGELPQDLEPEPFDEPAWVIGSLGGSYDIDVDRIILVAAEVTEEEATEGEATDDEEDELAEALARDPFAESAGAVARFGATREQMAALAIRGTSLISSGRPPCPLCGYPIDPTGHACPRTNGHRPPKL
jgi:uncharacterized repeat protein (TIGR03847 family)